MPLFVLTVLVIYGAMHAILYAGTRSLLPPGRAPRLALLGWIATMLLAPFLTRALEHQGLEGAARALALLGYTWMGLLFLACTLFVPLLVWDGATRLLSARRPHGPKSAAAVLVLVVLLGSWGAFEARDLRVETVRIETAKLPAGLDSLRVAQISDLHLGLLLREGTVQRLAAVLDRLRPDLLVATGDLVDAQIDHLDELAGLLAAIRTPLGKYAVTGNHEFYAGPDQALAFLERGGFTVLRGNSVEVGGIVLVGIDDPAGRGAPDELPLLRRTEPGRYTILLKHRPQLNPEAAGLFDLQLSGHAHRGQVVPFNLLTALRYPLQDGLTAVGDGAYLYASRGTGTWGPPMRLGSPPEVTLFEIVRAP